MHFTNVECTLTGKVLRLSTLNGSLLHSNIHAFISFVGRKEHWLLFFKHPSSMSNFSNSHRGLFTYVLNSEPLSPPLDNSKGQKQQRPATTIPGS